MLAAEFRTAISPVLASPVLRRLLPAFAVSAVGAQHTLLASAAATIACGLAATALLTARRRELARRAAGRRDLARPGAGRRRPWRAHGLSPGS